MGLEPALAGIVYRHPVTLVTDPGMEPMIVWMLRAYGADVDMGYRPAPDRRLAAGTQRPVSLS